MKTGSMILAILGAIVALPAALLGGLFGAAQGIQDTTPAGASLVGEAASNAAVNAAVDAAASGAKTYMYLGLLAFALAIVGAAMVKRPGKVGAGVVVASAVCAGISCMSGNPLAYAVTGLLGLAAVLGLLGGDAVAAGARRLA